MDQTAPPKPYRRILYRGGEGMWSFILHRGSGLLVLGFLFLHILDTSLVGLGEEHYNRFVTLYKSPLFRPLEVILVGAVIYHALNGIRVILIDFWDRGARYERQLAWAEAALSLALFLPAAAIMLRPLFDG
jgi:succinate dehydrogenase / fumarate reductase cytochrome b subunit